MATTIAIQELPANGGAINDLTYTAGDDSGMSFNNDGQTILVIKNIDAAATPSVTVEGVPAQDSGRDGTSVATLVAGVGSTAILGPFKPRNWNTGTGAVELTLTAPDALVVEIAAVRYELG